MYFTDYFLRKLISSKRVVLHIYIQADTFVLRRTREIVLSVLYLECNSQSVWSTFKRHVRIPAFTLNTQPVLFDFNNERLNPETSPAEQLPQSNVFLNKMSSLRSLKIEPGIFRWGRGSLFSSTRLHQFQIRRIWCFEIYSTSYTSHICAVLLHGTQPVKVVNLGEWCEINSALLNTLKK